MGLGQDVWETELTTRSERVGVERKEEESVLTSKFLSCIVNGGGGEIHCNQKMSFQTARMWHQATVALVSPSVKQKFSYLPFGVGVLWNGWHRAETTLKLVHLFPPPYNQALAKRIQVDSVGGETENMVLQTLSFRHLCDSYVLNTQ